MGVDAPSRPLRPLSVGEVVDASFRLYGRNWRTLLAIVAFVVVPVEILSFALQLSAVPDGATVVDGELQSSSGGDLDTGFLVAVLSTGLLGGLATLLATGALFRALAEAYLGRETDWRSSLRFGLARLVPLLWVTVLVVVGLVLGFLALIVPGIWLGVAWVVAVPALMIEDTRGPAALRRSMDLVKGRWWPTFGALLLLVLIAVLLGGVLGGVVAAVVLAGEPSVVTYFGLNSLANLIATLITTPLQAAIIAVIYFDLRVRKEGLDLGRLADSLERPEAAAVGPSSEWASPAPPMSPGSAPPGWEPPSPGR